MSTTDPPAATAELANALTDLRLYNDPENGGRDNRGVFPILSLATELRLLIYERLTPHAVIHAHFGARDRGMMDFPPLSARKRKEYRKVIESVIYDFASGDIDSIDGPYTRTNKVLDRNVGFPPLEPMNILMACRKVNGEFAPELHKTLEFVVSCGSKDMLVHTAQLVHMRKMLVVLARNADRKCLVGRLRNYANALPALASLHVSLETDS